MKNLQKFITKRGSTLFLRLAIFAVGTAVLAFCTFAIPSAWQAVAKDWEYASIAYAFKGILLCMLLASIPFFYALYQATQLLNYIDKGTAFAKRSVRALKRIAYCGVAVGLIYAVSLPFFYIWSQRDDAPGLVVIGMTLVGASLTVSVFAAVMQQLLHQAIAMKSENDLTV